MAQSIKIISAPKEPENFPEWIRKAWVGLIFPIHGGKFGGDVWDKFYPVDAATAISIAGKNNDEVARWWANCGVSRDGVFLFPKKICQLI